jgi:hypothetical protein
MGNNSVILTAYAYTDGTAVTSADVQLWYNTDVLSSVTYTDMGGGWYRLQKTFDATTGAKDYGIVVEAGKTVYVDTLSLQAGSGATITLNLSNTSSGKLLVKADEGIAAFGVTPPDTQPSKINDPSGGGTQDTEARTAINSIIDILEGAGLSSSS